MAEGKLSAEESRQPWRPAGAEIIKEHAQQIEDAHDVIASQGRRNMRLEDVIAHNNQLENEVQDCRIKMHELERALNEAHTNNQQQARAYDEHKAHALAKYKEAERKLGLQVQIARRQNEELKRNLNSYQHHVVEQKDASEKQVSELHFQVENLKKAIATSTTCDRDGETSDDNLKDLLGTWGLDVQNWVFSCCRGTKLGELRTL